MRTNRHQLRILHSVTTVREASASQPVRGSVRSSRWERLSHGPYVPREPRRLTVDLAAWQLVLPASGCFTSLTSAQLRGWWQRVRLPPLRSGADRARNPPTSSSLADEKRVRSLLLSTAERDPELHGVAPTPDPALDPLIRAKRVDGIPTQAWCSTARGCDSAARQAERVPLGVSPASAARRRGHRR
jgi:hypothetical protein